MFSATMRLPNRTDEQRKARVDKIIQDLGISDCANTRVGSVLTRGISGGERKRTSIAFELVADPTVLFLDEPTTGLDSFTANQIVEMLSRAADEHEKTIVATIHQPSSQIYASFDRLLLLS